MEGRREGERKEGREVGEREGGQAIYPGQPSYMWSLSLVLGRAPKTLVISLAKELLLLFIVNSF